MTSTQVGDYNEVWYAGGFDPIYELSPYTNYSPYLGAQPRLPMFTVYNNYAGANCPGLALLRSQCGGTRTEQHRWIWQPVTFATTSAIAPQAMVNAAADLWNAIQMPSKVNLSSDTSGHWDVNVLDAPTPQFFAGITAVYCPAMPELDQQIVETWAVHNRVNLYKRLGTGGVDFPAFFAVLRERQYAGWVTLDFDAPRPGEGTVEQDMNRHKKYLLETLHAKLRTSN